MTSGVDVSSYQGAFDWDAAKRKGAAFGIAKATEGLTIRDSRFVRNWGELKRTGLVRGAYHFGHPRNDPVAEAEFFYSVVGPLLEPGDLVVLDHEASDGTSAEHCAAWARAFTAHLELHAGRAPVVYTFLSFAQEGRCAGLGGYPLWIADPSRPAGQPRVPAPWSDWVMHQHAETGGVDQDVSKLSAEQLCALGQPQQEDDMAELVSLGVDGKQKIPANSVGAVLFSKAYSDKHNLWHEDKDGTSYSIIVDSTLWAIADGIFELHGLDAGASVDVAWSRMTAPTKAGDEWQLKDDAWRLTYTANKDGVIRSEIGGQFGLDQSVRLRLRVYNSTNREITVQGCMAKVSLFKY